MNLDVNQVKPIFVNVFDDGSHRREIVYPGKIINKKNRRGSNRTMLTRELSKMPINGWFDN